MSDPTRTHLQSVGAADPAVLAFNDRLEALLKDLPPPSEVPVDLVRQLRAEGKGAFPSSGPLPEAAWREIDPEALGAAAAADGPRRVRVIEAEGAPTSIVVHIHGGGWTFGSPEQFDGRCLRLARAIGAMSVSIAYRLAPENRWPACGEDALAGALWALEEARRLGGLPVFITGESAGAHLSATTLLRLRDLGRLGEITAAGMIYGCFDLAMTPSMRNWGERKLILSTPITAWFVDNLLGEDAPRLMRSPEVSPLWADLSGMPPSLFQVGDADPLLDDSLFMAERWRMAGSEAELMVWPGGVHGLDYFDRPHNGFGPLPIALPSQAATAAYFKKFLRPD